MEFFLDDDGFKKNENRVQGLWSNNMKRKEYKSHRKILTALFQFLSKYYCFMDIEDGSRGHGLISMLFFKQKCM